MPQQLIHRLAELAPKLRPELLHRVIEACGLENCVELVAHATPAQLSHLFDLDLWRSSRPGLDEQFDAGRFGLWLEVLVEAGPEVAAAKLADMPLPQLVAGLAQHVRVFDVSAVSSYETTDGTTWEYSRPVRDRVGCEIGGYHVAAIRETAWDAIVDVLVALDTHHPERFVELMRAVRSRSHSRREADGCHALLQNREQMMFEVADERERRRDARGFVSPADARAFLQMSRGVKPGHVTPNPFFRACSHAVASGAIQDHVPQALAAAEAEAAELLAEAGIEPARAPAALLGGGDATHATRLQRYMRVVSARDAVMFGERHLELAHLSNVLIAGCSLQGRAFTAREAADAAVAICNLGLEHLPDAPDYLMTHDLVGAFQVGWGLLHEQVCHRSARTLADVLGTLRVADAEDQSSINMLRVRLLKATEQGMPWRAAGSLDVLATIDLPAWAALTSLIAECPVMHGGVTAATEPGVHAVDAGAFEFISRAEQLEQIRNFLGALPALLSVRSFT